MTRFWSKVDKTETCWNWLAYKSPKGYGRFRFQNKSIFAHRFSWFLKYKHFPELLVLHKCDNRACVNPEHLFLGTNQDNVTDMVNKNRQAGAKGINNKKAKLTEKDVLKIRELYKNGTPQKKLAILFKVTSTHISRIVTKQNWSHL